MSPVSVPIELPLPASIRGLLEELANSGALDQISNFPGSVRRYIKGTAAGAPRGDKLTWKSIFFVIYQTGRYGPQNGFRLCPVHEDFDTESDMGEAENEIEQDVREFIVLGPKPPQIEDPRENLLEHLSDAEHESSSNSSLMDA